jgi:4a-hydroxytetrahydrobiopterin dehydratase
MADDQVLSDEEIDRELESLPGWECRDGWLRREYKTPGFAHTMMLANTIGYLSEAAWHHPDLKLGYAQVIVKLQTHRVRAVTTHDTELARKIHDVVTWLPDEESALDGFPKKWIQ